MYRHLSYQGALGIATNIKTATHNIDRNMMARLDFKHGGLRNICRFLRAAGLLTVAESRAAIHTLPKIKNPSVRRYK